MFLVILFLIAKKENNPHAHRINKMLSLHIVEIYSAIKRNWVFIHVTVWMLSERNQTQTVTHAMIPLA